ncbi:hypothetical protein [Liquorilactobacillus mali]|uniref:YtxH domain-containing protein n=1 Tax=Liquorilactobacillus mali KCTC 3596 = DSM 20444 TaxID=1046596 RepID=J0L7N2_9LACO|nr:hypothetical protein [Liquorilactobacillus mali]EJF01428.1 hypothetical protein LMA_01229 [Liquorilactobacillus mali KCTC 3596 = DSM 20444]KRN10113.1 hypothetical protein FD00_GL000495 [Liquorilactobacillus mali KCTC 3596 = DSM 20444]MDC7953842.1 hypothetical protein [Liquorilactobacillus mali]MDV7758535.1 hypothetical protein [Liquorilactobacillus mali]QFQ75187.1 hypothetical protein LM596_08745 [Liquorilactobacillus mali]
MGRKLSVFTTLAVGTAAYFITKKVLSDHQEQIKEKVAQLTDEGRENAVRYYNHARDYVNEGYDLQDTLNELKQKVVDTAESLKNNDNVEQALSSLKEATSELKSQFNKEKNNENDDVVEDDIVIDGRSAFGEAKDAAEFEKDHPTEVFYPKED